AVIEHRSERRDTRLLNVVTEEQLRLHPHLGSRARLNVEAIGAGNPRSVQQRVYPHRLASSRRSLQPEIGIGRDLFPGRQPGIDRQPTRGQSKPVVTPDASEIAGTTKHQKLVGSVLVVQWEG